MIIKMNTMTTMTIMIWMMTKRIFNISKGIVYLNPLCICVVCKGLRLYKHPSIIARFIYMSFQLSLSIFVFFYISIYLSIYSYIYYSLVYLICLSILIYVYMCLNSFFSSISLPIYMGWNIHLFIKIYVCIYLYAISIYLSIYPSIMYWFYLGSELTKLAHYFNYYEKGRGVSCLPIYPANHFAHLIPYSYLNLRDRTINLFIYPLSV